MLTPDQAEAFTRLPLFDQHHLIGVHRRILSSRAINPDLLLAGLLHDIGKADQVGHVRLSDRTLRVVLRRFSPGLLERLARLPAAHWRHGLALAVHHPALGADAARRLGCSQRTCWLIAHHEDLPPVIDPDLLALQTVDRTR